MVLALHRAGPHLVGQGAPMRCGAFENGGSETSCRYVLLSLVNCVERREFLCLGSSFLIKHCGANVSNA